jgi:replication factor A1
MIDELIRKIAAGSGIDQEEIARMVDEKQIEFSGLVSEEGAAYIVAKELGVELRRETEKLDIANVMPGMQNVDIIAKVTRIFPAREFKTEKAEGKVANIILADRTGSVRMSLWNDEIEKLQGIEIGDVVNVRGFVRESLGQPEIRLGRKGLIAKAAGAAGFDNVVYERAAERSSIVELQEGFYRSIRAPIVQVFETNVFYEICPDCRKRAKEQEDGFYCAEHGLIENLDYGLIVSGIIDDGTASIRAVFFTDAAEKILGISKAEAKNLFDRKKKLEAVLSLIPLGKEFILEGKARKNNFFDRLEFVVNNIKPVDIKKEVEMLMEGD